MAQVKIYNTGGSGGSGGGTAVILADTGTANTMRWVSYVNGVEILYAT